MSQFAPYLEHGWRLTPIPPGSKGPRHYGWNERDKCISDPNTHLLAAGLCHAYSGTCAIDVDNYPAAAEWLAERGVNLDDFFLAPDAVQISSGRKDHGKLLYALPEPLPSKKIKLDGHDVIDFRCATREGLTVQDVLPPTIHPDTGEPYRWIYDQLFVDWRTLPALPDALRNVWVAQLDSQVSRDDVPEKGASTDELRELLNHQDPGMSRDDWVRVGMALHHETDGGAEGLDLWDEWSQGSEKYAGKHDLETVWRSFHDTKDAITVGMLRRAAIASPDEFPNIVDASSPDPWEQVAQEKRARFALTHVSEIAKRDPPDWIVDQIVPKADLAMMYGQPSAGKSFLALDLAFAVAHGFTWFNRATEKNKVVWVAAEAAGSMRNRVKAYAQAKGIRLETADLLVMDSTLSLMSDDDAGAVIDVLSAERPGLVIVDTLAAASGGANENSGEDMNKVLDSCRRIHEATGALVLLVHHSGKDASRGARGWSGLLGAMDAEYQVQHNEDASTRIMRVSKQRNGEAGLRLPFKLQKVPLGFDDQSSCFVEQLDEAMLDAQTKQTLGGNQKIVFEAIYNLCGAPGTEAGVPIQDVYDDALIEMPKPIEGKRDRRDELVRRALAKLHERGLITIHNDTIQLGSAYDGNDEDLSVPEMQEGQTSP